jgi:hypothetical protein
MDFNGQVDALAALSQGKSHVYKVYTPLESYTVKNCRFLTLPCCGAVGRRGEMRGAYRVLVGKPVGNRPLGKPSRRWEDFRMDLQEMECGWLDWIELAQDIDRWWALANAVMNLRVP